MQWEPMVRAKRISSTVRKEKHGSRWTVSVTLAIRFVVNDVFAPLRQEERQQLLHVGDSFR